jgi:hypothetical protein
MQVFIRQAGVATAGGHIDTSLVERVVGAASFLEELHHLIVGQTTDEVVLAEVLAQSGFPDASLSVTQGAIRIVDFLAYCRFTGDGWTTAAAGGQHGSKNYKNQNTQTHRGSHFQIPLLCGSS